MVKKFKEVTRVPICLEKDVKYQVEIQGNEVVISKEFSEPEWTDITKGCSLVFKESQHCDGNYIAIMYMGSKVAVIGTAGIQPQHGFKVEKPAGAFTSFTIYKKT